MLILAAATAALHPLSPVRPRRSKPVLLRSGAPQMMPTALLFPAVAGGTFAGGLHAVTGPDHLAALLPLCMGRRWYEAASTGAFWGLGHGAGAALVGMIAFALRGALNLHALAPYMEAAVGASIVVIGVTGYRESREWADSVEQCELDLSAATMPGASTEEARSATDIDPAPPPPPPPPPSPPPPHPPHFPINPAQPPPPFTSLPAPPLTLTHVSCHVHVHVHVHPLHPHLHPQPHQAHSTAGVVMTHACDEPAPQASCFLSESACARKWALPPILSNSAHLLTPAFAIYAIAYSRTAYHSAGGRGAYAPQWRA